MAVHTALWSADVVDIEVSQFVQPVAPGAPGRGQFVLLRWCGVPFGRLERRPGSAPLTRERLEAELSHELRQNLLKVQLRLALEQGVEGSVLGATPAGATGVSPPADYPTITVAVCTRERPADLVVCLRALLELDYPALDILVVENAPCTHTLADVVARDFPRVRYACEPKPGLNRARNVAIREARGDILAFADDDTIVDRGWAKALAHVFMRGKNVAAVAGLVVPHEIDTPAQHAFELYGGFGRGYVRSWYSISGRRDPAEAFHVGAGRFGTGANMAYRRSVFDEIGEFDPALDVGTPTEGGGDLDMFFRVIEHELVLVYEPAAVVRHRHRRTFPELERQIMSWGTGFNAFLMRNAAAYPRRRAAILRFAAWYMAWRYVRGALKAVRARSLWRLRLISVEAWGALKSAVCYRRARRVAEQLDAAPAT